uniref:RNA polymerase sigma-70 factor n=1 Tax=uncultured Draconibacterium sp. TaxID=1573823 RepID=UPI00321723B8
MKEITEFMRKRDIISFEKIFRLYSPRLRKYALHFLQDKEEANDLIQDVFIQFWIQKESLDAEKNVESFLFTLLKNKCLNSLKKSVVEEKYIKRQTYLETEKLYHLSFNSQHDFVNMEDLLKKELNKAMTAMPERCRTAFQLKWLEGKKQREIADIMNISMTMVNKHLAKGMEIARKFIKPELLVLLVISH